MRVPETCKCGGKDSGNLFWAHSPSGCSAFEMTVMTATDDCRVHRIVGLPCEKCVAAEADSRPSHWSMEDDD